MQLATYAERYVRLVDGSDGYREQLAVAVHQLERHAGRELTLADLSEDLLTDWLDGMRKCLSDTTRRNRRNMLLRIWRDAARHGLHRWPNPELVQRVRLQSPIPRAWSIEQVRTLLAIAGTLRGRYKRRWPKSLFWQAWILVTWDTGLRACDMFRLRIADVGERIVVRQVKTRRPVYLRLRPAALAAIASWLDATGRDRECVFVRWTWPGTWRATAQRLVERARLPGSIGWLRRSAGTAAELAHPQQGYQFLGNSPATFYRYYFDRSFADVPQPPEL